MKASFVTAIAVLFCCVVVALVSLFGYSRFKAGQNADAAFRQQLQSTSQSKHAALDAQMPGELPGASALDANPSPAPARQ